MDLPTILGILSLGFSLGLLHALDADHIMAVSVLAAKIQNLRSRRQAAITTIRYCLKWATGHGGALMLVGGLALLLGWQLPAAVSHWAERLIGILLIVLGTWLIYKALTNKIQLHVHKHENEELVHVHLTQDSNSQHSHQPVLVGLVHGLAGSAPVLALIPALQTGQHWLGMAYLLLFCIGVVVSMLVFGLFFGQLQVWLTRFGQGVYKASRLIIGASSIVFGSYWLLNT